MSGFIQTAPALPQGQYPNLSLTIFQVTCRSRLMLALMLFFSIGLVQGGIQSLSRSLYSDLVPPERAAEFFGFYNMMGKSAALFGPLIVGAVAVWLEDHRLAMLSIIILFLLGATLLYFVKPREKSVISLP